MPYPPPPTLNPFNASDVPNLMESGPYGTVLTAIENYLKQLGAYVDAQVSAVRGEIPSTDDFATAAQLEQVSETASAAQSAATAAQSAATTASQTATAAQSTASAAQSAATTASKNLTNLVGTLNNITVGADKLIMGINSDGTGTPTSPAAESITEEATNASAVAQQAKTGAETANAAIGTWSNSNTIGTILGNMLNVAFPLPTQINEGGTGVTQSDFKLFGATGTIGNAQNAFGNILASIMLAAPNGDQTQLLGYLGDNSESIASSPKIRSSAALTAAYDSGGSEESVPVSVDITYYNHDERQISMSTYGNAETIYPAGTTFIATSQSADPMGIRMIMSTQPITFSESGEPFTIAADNVTFDEPNSTHTESSAKLLIVPAGSGKSGSDAALTSSDLSAMKKTTDGFAYVG